MSIDDCLEKFLKEVKDVPDFKGYTVETLRQKVYRHQRNYKDYGVKINDYK